MPGPLENPNIKKFYQQAPKPFNYVPNDLVSGNPTIPPMMSGLMRIDPGTGNIWISAGNTLVSDWKLITGGGGGGTYNGDQGVYKDTSLTPETFMLGTPFSSLASNVFLENRYVNASTFSLVAYGQRTVSGRGYLSSILESKTIYSTEDDVQSGLDIYRLSSTNNGENGIGAAVRLYSQVKYGLVPPGYQQAPDVQLASFSVDADPTLSRKTAFSASVNTGNSLAEVIFSSTSKTELKSASLQFNSYGSGANTGSPAYTLGVDGFGNVVEYITTPPSSGITYMVSTPGTFNVDSTWNDIIGLAFNIAVGKSYSFKAVISYSILDETDGGTIWAAIDDGTAAYSSSSYYCQVWDGSGLVTYPSNEVGLLPSTSSISNTTYNDRSNIAIVEGVISNVTVGGTIKIQGLGKSGGLGGNTVTYNEGSSLTIYELP